MMGEWNPNMDEAPKDGTVIWGGTKTSGKWPRIPYPMRLRYSGGVWVNASDGRAYDPQPTHWRPSPPTEGEE